MIGVDIHILDTSTLEGEEERILSLIAPCYVQKYEKMKVPRAKKEELGAGYLLYKVLGITRDEQLTAGEFGKPGLSKQYFDKSKKGDDSSDVVKLGDCHEDERNYSENSSSFTEFSLSHTDKYVVLAVSTEPVGVDIERCDRLTLQILERVLPQNYYEKLVNEQKDAESSETLKELAKAWTSVEAVLKADGKGFSVDPRKDAAFLDDWHIESFSLDDEYMVSCACREPIDVRVIRR